MNSCRHNNGKSFNLTVFLLLSTGILLITEGQLPEFSWVAFSTYRDGNWEVYVMDSSGEQLRNLTNHPGDDWHPNWSPDGRMVVFNSSRDANDGTSSLYTMNSDGENIKRITNPPAPFLGDFDAAWSPDGRLLTFMSYRLGAQNTEIFVAEVDGKNLMNLTNHPSRDEDPAWSLDGTAIAFVSNRDQPPGQVGRDLFVMKADGSRVLRLTDGKPGNYSAGPTWSPRGNQIAFYGWEPATRQYEIYVVNAGGGGLRNLTQHPAADTRPTWSRDGNGIAFVSNRDGNEEIHTMDFDGQNVQRLTFHPERDTDPDWFTPGRSVSTMSRWWTSWGWLKRSGIPP